MDPNCTDFIEITDSVQLNAQTLSAILCRSTAVPVAFSTKRRKLFVRFVSDRYQTIHAGKHGFKAEYEVFSRTALRAGKMILAIGLRADPEMLEKGVGDEI